MQEFHIDINNFELLPFVHIKLSYSWFVFNCLLKTGNKNQLKKWVSTYLFFDR